MRRNPRDRFFNIFPYIFIGAFALIATGVIVQFAVIGTLGYHVLMDPEGSAKYIGEITGEANHHIVHAMEENQ